MSTFESVNEAATFLHEVGAPPPGILSFRNWARLARMRRLPSDVAARVDAAEQLLESAAVAARSAQASGCRRIGGVMLCTDPSPGNVSRAQGGAS